MTPATRPKIRAWYPGPVHVLVIEDHSEVRELVTRSLAKEGHRITAVSSLTAANEALAQSTCDIVVLDIGLPDGDGLEWCGCARMNGASFPILVLTAQSSVPKRVAGLDAGADDFIAKPFAVAELRARVRALLRRGSIQAPTVYEKAAVRLDFAGRRAHIDGREAPLTAREWGVAELLVARRGRVVARSSILRSVWGDETENADASLEVIIARIRKKLGGAFIRTVRGEGYVVE